MACLLTLPRAQLKALPSILLQRCRCRSIFSLTGVWPKLLEEDHLRSIESHWKPLVPKLVKEAQAEIVDEDKHKYVLSMFPYPSGQLHMGHVRVYAISDAMAHYHRLMGNKVIHPMGWDAFGLPAENAAIERKIQPQAWTKQNIQTMKSQLEDLACLFDWDREITTCQPEYYRWTQYLFVKMFKEGLAYQKEAIVNWDPIDQTVLADEQVDDRGRSWRSGALVEKKPLNQWFLRTTRFSKDLYEGLDDPSLENWKDIVKIQRNWIGECTGTSVEFKLDDIDQKLTVWTDRPELLSLVAFIGIGPDHILNQDQNILGTFSDGLKLKLCAINPFTGIKIPILVLKKFEDTKNDSFLGIPSINQEHATICFKADILYLPESPNSDQTTCSEEAREKAMEKLREMNVGGYWVSSHLKDWLVSRQRYWGTPIPVIHCSSCGAVPVNESDLPVELPILDTLSVKGKSPLLLADDWINVPCPSCGKSAKRETDTMDTFVDSSWYFARYLDPKNDQEPFSREAAKNLPVDLYIGGKEHATLHMYFARFFTHFMHHIGLSPVKEPFQSLLVQGMVKGKSYRLKGSGQYLHPHEVDTSKTPPIEIASGKPVVEEWEKMSKSKYNGVDPGDILKQYGSDTTKLLILSDVSPQADRKWNPEDSHHRIESMQRRIWRLMHQMIDFQGRDDVPEVSKEAFEEHSSKCWDARNYYLRGANFAYRETQNFAMVQARIQGLLGDLWTCHGRIKRDSSEFQRALATAILLLTPMAPHFCSELWNGFAKCVPVKHCRDFRWDKSVFHQSWPELDQNYNLKLLIQKSGELVSEVPIALWKFRELNDEEAFNIACCDEKVQELILPKVFKHTFTKLRDNEAIIDFSVEEPKLTKEEKKRLKEEKKEAKKLRLIRREEKIAKIQADIDAKKARLNKEE